VPVLVAAGIGWPRTKCDSDPPAATIRGPTGPAPPSSATAAPRPRGATATARRFCPLPASPHADFQLQLDAESFLHASAHQVDETQHIAGRAAGMRDEEGGVALAGFRATNARLDQAGLLDQGGGTQAAWILEDAPGGLIGKRLAGLSQDPCLAHPLD